MIYSGVVVGLPGFAWMVWLTWDSAIRSITLYVILLLCAIAVGLLGGAGMWKFYIKPNLDAFAPQEPIDETRSDEKAHY